MAATQVEMKMLVGGYEDVWTKIDLCRKHYAACGLTANYVEQFIR